MGSEVTDVYSTLSCEQMGGIIKNHKLSNRPSIRAPDHIFIDLDETLLGGSHVFDNRGYGVALDDKMERHKIYSPLPYEIADAKLIEEMSRYSHLRNEEEAKEHKNWLASLSESEKLFIQEISKKSYTETIEIIKDRGYFTLMTSVPFWREKCISMCSTLSDPIKYFACNWSYIPQLRYLYAVKYFLNEEIIKYRSKIEKLTSDSLSDRLSDNGCPNTSDSIFTDEQKVKIESLDELLNKLESNFYEIDSDWNKIKRQLEIIDIKRELVDIYSSCLHKK